MGARHFAATKAFEVVDRALDVSGGAAAFTQSRLEQPFRDVWRGRLRRGDTLRTHELVGRLCLGLDPRP